MVQRNTDKHMLNPTRIYELLMVLLITLFCLIIIFNCHSKSSLNSYLKNSYNVSGAEIKGQISWVYSLAPNLTSWSEWWFPPFLHALTFTCSLLWVPCVPNFIVLLSFLAKVAWIIVGRYKFGLRGQTPPWNMQGFWKYDYHGVWGGEHNPGW